MSDPEPATAPPPDLHRRTLTTFGYGVTIVVPVLLAALGLALLHLNYDDEDLVKGQVIPILTSDWQPGDAAMTALASGRLTLGDDGCLRLGETDVVWPADYEAAVQRVGSAEQVSVYDADRTVVARSGQELEVGGGLVDAATYAGRPCAPPSGEVFEIQSSVKVAGRS